MPVELELTPELSQAILGRLSNGESLFKICNTDGMPCRNTVMKWVETRPDFCEQYTRARENGSEALVEKLHDITDDILSGTITPEQGRVVLNSLQWLVIKMKPQKYGDKPSNLTINNNTDNRRVDVVFDTLKLAPQHVLDAAKKQIVDALSDSDNTTQNE